MAGTVQAKKCCCACWYRVPICPCEPDEERFPLYIPCALLEAFFDAHPELENHLVFKFWDGLNWLCYDMQRLDELIVHVIPDEPPPIIIDIPDEDDWYPPPLDDCIFCCPNPCCPICWGNPNHEGCCWHPDDVLTVTVEWEETYTIHYCCLPDGGIEWVYCEPGTATCEYDLVACDPCGVLWMKRPPAQCTHDPTDCLWSWWLFVCYPCDLPLCWTNSEDMNCGGPCDGPMVCADILPACCPPENEPHACTLIATDDFDPCSCWGLHVSYDCEYPAIIDCPNWSGGGPPPSWPPPPGWGVGGLCTCGNQRWTYRLEITPTCFSWPPGNTWFTGGMCFPEPPDEPPAAPPGSPPRSSKTPDGGGAPEPGAG